MDKTYTRQELLDKGAIQDGIGQLRLVHDMGVYLLCQVFLGGDRQGFEFTHDFKLTKDECDINK